MTNYKPLCIYHGNCADGFGAAWVVRRAVPGVEFYAGKYQTPPPDVTDRQVIIVDFSYPSFVLREMCRKASSVLVIDHHKSAIDDIIDMVKTNGKPDNLTLQFSLENSGAMLAWIHYFPSLMPPPLLRHIEDRDLWRFELPKTREIQANLFSYPYDFAVWDALMGSNMELLAMEGEAIERKHHKDIKEMLRVTQRELRIDGHVVPAANLPYIYSSDAGEIMGKDALFAACYWDTPDGRVFSLRSDKYKGADVSLIAKKYGGGGHRNAAGFKVSLKEAQEFEV